MFMFSYFTLMAMTIITITTGTKQSLLCGSHIAGKTLGHLCMLNILYMFYTVKFNEHEGE